MDYMSADALPALPENDGSAYVARYALGRDYHKTVRRRLARLGQTHQRAAWPTVVIALSRTRRRCWEKPLAAKAGIGWMGKNTLVLNENAGSMFFLGEIYTNIPLPLSTASAPDQCGACKACINVCPTGAILRPPATGRHEMHLLSHYREQGRHPAAPAGSRGQPRFRLRRLSDRLSLEPLRENNGGSGLRAASRAGQREPCRSVELGRSDVLREDRGNGTQARQLSAMGSQPCRGGRAMRPYGEKLIELLCRRRQDADEMVTEHIDWALARQRARRPEADMAGTAG